MFYELGLAHALAKPAILIAETMDDIPFDLHALRIVVYDKNDPRWGQRLQERIESAIQEVLRSPQEAVLPAFLNVREATEPPTVTAWEKESIEVKQELELLKREVRRSSMGSLLPPQGAPGPFDSRLSEQEFMNRFQSDRSRSPDAT